MSCKPIPPFRRKAPSFPERKNIKTVQLPIKSYKYWVIDVQQRAIYYHNTIERVEATVERLRKENPNKTFQFCPKYLIDTKCQTKTAS